MASKPRWILKKILSSATGANPFSAKLVCIRLVLAAAAIGMIVVNSVVGYYQTRWIEDDQLIFSIKKSPTFKISFINVFRTDHEDNWNGYLEDEERQFAIDFCKYSVGFDTPMNTMNDYEACGQIYESTVTYDSPSSDQNQACP